MLRSLLKLRTLPPQCFGAYRQLCMTHTLFQLAEMEDHGKQIFWKGVSNVLPDRMITNNIQVTDHKMTIGTKEYELSNNVHIVAFGKAVLGMVRVAEDILGNHVVGGIASVPNNMRNFLRDAGLDRVQVLEGAKNNFPDDHALENAKKIYKYLTKLKQNDIVLCLISGGGSALLPLPRLPVTLQELVDLAALLQRRGANIQQLNTVRKHLEVLKGGGLAEAAQPAQVVSLILSDVIGDPLDLIASGPTAPDYSTVQQCLDLFELYNLESKVPASVKSVLMKSRADVRRKDDFTISSNDEVFEKTLSSPAPLKPCSNAHNVIVGNNSLALSACENEARTLGYLPYTLTTTQEGEARDVGGTLARLGAFISDVITRGPSGTTSARAAQLELELVARGLAKGQLNDLVTLAHQAVNTGRGLCVLTAGETTVTVQGGGKGGRNTELALAAAVELDNHEALECDVMLLSGATDGQDGATDAAGCKLVRRARRASPGRCRAGQEDVWRPLYGAFLYDVMVLVGAVAFCGLASSASSAGVSPAHHLSDNDSYSFYSNLWGGRHLYRTGLTCTNVMDIQVLLARRKTDRK